MDRCRCPDYAAAVKKLRFYTVGTHRPDIIDNYDRSKYTTVWVKKTIDHCDMKFAKPKAWKILQEGEQPENYIPKAARDVEQMWCPYMSPYKLQLSE